MSVLSPLPPPSVTSPSWTDNPVEWCLWLLRTNGHVYKAFRREVMRRVELAEAEGRKRALSADDVVHSLRWDTDTTAEGETFKLNNNAVALLPRLFQAEFPQLSKGVFRLRRSLLDELEPSEWGRILVAFEPLRVSYGRKTA
jgi:hypothetical protein